MITPQIRTFPSSSVQPQTVSTDPPFFFFFRERSERSSQQKMAGTHWWLYANYCRNTQNQSLSTALLYPLRLKVDVTMSAVLSSLTWAVCKWSSLYSFSSTTTSKLVDLTPKKAHWMTYCQLHTELFICVNFWAGDHFFYSICPP